MRSDNLAIDAAALMQASLAERLRQADRVSLAVSGGTTPWAALEGLASADLEWNRVDIYQVDERVAPPDDPSRNLVCLRAALTGRVAATLHPMPVDTADLPEAAAAYAASLPIQLDVVQLGLGADGHTASLIPSDAALTATADVAITAPYQGHRRMTLTFSPLNRARTIIWIVGGAEKRDAVTRLLKSDATIPAGRIDSDRATLIADAAALGE